MSGEHVSTPNPVSLSKEVEVYKAPVESNETLKREFGKHALAFEGFTPLGEAESQYAYVRDELEGRIKGQPEAVQAIIEALERSESRLPNDPRPIANFAFLGLSGTGKTEAAKALSAILSGGTPNIIKIDGAQYSEKHTIAALVGSPAGYVGHGNKNDPKATPPIFSPDNLKKPGTIILLDEIEKAHEALRDILLHAMEGDLKLFNGEYANFRNCILIMSSNKGAEEIIRHTQKHSFGYGSESTGEPNYYMMKKSAIDAFKKGFKNEFINRLNKLIVFRALDREVLTEILDVKLEDVNVEYIRQFGVKTSLSQGTIDYLVDIALTEKHMGARPLVRAFEDNILTPVGRYTGSETVKEGTHIRVFHADEAPDNYAFPGNKKTDLIFTQRKDPDLKSEISHLRDLEKQKASGQGALELPMAKPTVTVTPTYDKIRDEEEFIDDDLSQQELDNIQWKRPEGPQLPPL